MKKILMTLLASAAALAAGASLAQSQGVSKDEILVGSIQDLSGPLAAFGKAVRQGMLLRAEEVNEREAPELYGIVRRLSQRAGLPMPRVYTIPEEAPNAFATGRDPNHGAVAVTHGLVRLLDRNELAGVIAHELAHIKNRDTLVMTVAATLAGAIGMLASAYSRVNAMPKRSPRNLR